MTIVSRAYNTFSTDNVHGTITKFSETERLLDEINYYQHIHEYQPNQRIHFPRLINTNTKILPYSMTLELYGYKDLGKYLIGDEYINSQRWADIFHTLKVIFQEWDAVAITDNMVSYIPSEFERNARAMYITKTETEYQSLVKLFGDKYPDFNPTMFTNYGYEINGLLCDNFEYIWPSVKTYIESNLLSYAPVMIHGDGCLSNMLYANSCNVIRFLDPRGSFGAKGIYGDRRYDIAKLYHSVDGKYEFIINDKFELACQGNQYQLSYSRKDNPGKSEFEEVILSNYSKKDIKLIQGLIFVGMAARHYDSYQRQEIMYYTGIRLLNEAMAL